MAIRGSGKIDQSVPSTVINESRVKELFSDQLLHEETRDFIKKVVLETLGHEDGIAKIKKYATEATKEYIQQDNSQKKSFWIPVIISIISTLVAIGAVVVAIMKP